MSTNCPLHLRAAARTRLLFRSSHTPADAQDEFALETIPNAAGEVGFVCANQADGSVYCDFLDGKS